MLAIFQSASSAACVPERSPREMNGAAVALIGPGPGLGLRALLPQGSALHG